MGESREVWEQKLIPFFIKLWLHPHISGNNHRDCIGSKKDCCYTLCNLVFQEKKAINLEHPWEWGLIKQQQPELQVDLPKG